MSVHIEAKQGEIAESDSITWWIHYVQNISLKHF